MGRRWGAAVYNLRPREALGDWNKNVWVAITATVE